MPPLFQGFFKGRDFFFWKTYEPELLRFDVDHQKEAHVIENGDEDGGFHDDHIINPQDFHDNEYGAPHDGGHQESSRA